MYINNLIIEVTRRCNMECQHCLRGDQQNSNISLDYVETLFQKVNYISSITFTGGEPSLVPEIIESVLKIAKEYEVGIGNFFIATNGKDIPDAFVIACLHWYLYCDDNEVSSVTVSTDHYHEGYEGDILKALSFYDTRGDIPTEAIIREGNAEDWGYRDHDDYEFDVEEDNIEGDVYLNINGDIISGCDWSYENQECHKVCHVNDMTIESFKEYRQPNLAEFLLPSE